MGKQVERRLGSAMVTRFTRSAASRSTIVNPTGWGYEILVLLFVLIRSQATLNNRPG
jgi:hypothetical protein